MNTTRERELMTSLDKSENRVRVLALGDVVGKPGRVLLRKALPVLKAAYRPDAVVVNVENAAGGFGITDEIYRELEAMGIDCMTSGNHVFDKRDCEQWMPWAVSLLRPENFPPGTVGRGSGIFQLAGGLRLGVINLIGRTFMKNYDCPFRAVDALLPEIKRETPLVLVDFHAEATSEKTAMGWYLAGRVSAVWGTHTHIPTADARILEESTGYITDLGMTGSYHSVIGMKKEPVIEGFRTLQRTRFEVAKGDERLGGCLFDMEKESGRCMEIRSLFLGLEDLGRIEKRGS